jgi:hypothetical protein
MSIIEPYDLSIFNISNITATSPVISGVAINVMCLLGGINIGYTLCSIGIVITSTWSARIPAVLYCHTIKIILDFGMSTKCIAMDDSVSIHSGEYILRLSVIIFELVMSVIYFIVMNIRLFT